MAISLQETLEKAGIPYELIQHETPIRTAAEGAAYFGIDPGQTAPTLILKTGSTYFGLIFSGDRGYVDLENVALLLEVAPLQLAKPKEVKLVTGCDVGNVPMAGLSVPVVIDRRLFRYGQVYGGSGRAGLTLKLAPQDLKRLNTVVAEFD